jgi:hypothetical protein
MTAYCAFQRVAGISINGLMANGGKAQNAVSGENEKAMAFLEIVGWDKLSILLWAGLRHEDSALTVEDAERLMNLAEGDSVDVKFVNLFQKILEAIVLSKGKTMEEVETDTLKKKEIQDPVSNSTGPKLAS